MHVKSHSELLCEAPGGDHQGECRCGEHDSHAQVQLKHAVIGLAFVLNAYLYGVLVEPDSLVAGFSAMIGALFLGHPIIRVALKDLRSGSLNTNVLVALAVLALFASGHYREAGIVSFFMLLGQIIETRTAEGALASIHSLIKLTPTKARRLVANQEEEVRVGDLVVGDLIRVRPGDNVAADGIIVSGRGSFNRINAFVFDKTGTLTTGRLAVSRLAPLGETTPADLLRVAASVEQFSNHPTAKALTQLAAEAGVQLSIVTEFSEATGRGVTAQLDGNAAVIGRAKWLRLNQVKDGFDAAVDLEEAQGWSLVFVAVGQRCIGWIGLQDQAREDAREALSALRDTGIRRVAMVSGDRQPVATRVGCEIGCDEVLGDCLPQNKVEFVRKLHAKGYRVAVVGDGVNDAPALAAGDLGIAMGAAGSEVAIQSATIALMNNDLRRLPFLLRLSRMTRSVINQNILLGLAFVIGGMVLAGLNYISPVVAAVFHVTGSLMVVFNSFRLVRQGEEYDGSPAEEAAAITSQAHAGTPLQTKAFA